MRDRGQAIAPTRKADTVRRPGYRMIAETLVADIREGETWSIGAQLPTEAELVERFGTSRNTVREALRELELQGFIRRQRGTRSILIARDPAENFVNSVQSIEELLQYSRRTDTRVISVELVVATEELAGRLGVADGSRWLRLELLRMPQRGTLPIGLSEIYVDSRYAYLAHKMRCSSPVYKVLEEELGIAFRRVEQSIEAGPAPAAIAEYLKIPPASPLLLVRTDFISTTGEIVEIGFGHFPGERYRMEVVLERSRNASTD